MRSVSFPSARRAGPVLLPLSACDTLRRDAGLTKQSPDEFAVVTKAPLIIPPNFNLHPPAPGAPPLNQQGPPTAPRPPCSTVPIPQTAAASMGGNRLGRAHAAGQCRGAECRSAIRAELKADDRTAAAAADQSFTDRVLNGCRARTAPPKKAAPAPKK